MNTKQVVSRILHAKYQEHLKELRKPLKSFREITGGLTKVIVSPTKAETENNIHELSQQKLRSYVKGASKDVKQRHDQYANDIKSGREPQFKDVFRKIGNRAAGMKKASRRSLRHEWAPRSVSQKIKRDS